MLASHVPHDDENAMTDAVRRIPTDRPDLYAFEIAGEVSSADQEAMADTMNAAFDAHEDKVDMLLVFRGYEGAETGSTLDVDVLKSRLRSIAKVNRYVVVGAPSAANSMIETMGKLMPVESHTFGIDELGAAWTLLGARPAGAAGAAPV